MGEWGAEWQSQFSSEMSFAPGEERTPAEKLCDTEEFCVERFYATRRSNVSQNLASAF